MCLQNINARNHKMIITPSVPLTVKLRAFRTETIHFKFQNQTHLILTVFAKTFQECTSANHNEEFKIASRRDGQVPVIQNRSC